MQLGIIYTSVSEATSKMFLSQQSQVREIPQWVRAQWVGFQPGDLSWTPAPHAGKRKLTPQHCPLTSTPALLRMHVITRAHTYQINRKVIKNILLKIWVPYQKGEQSAKAWRWPEGSRVSRHCRAVSCTAWDSVHRSCRLKPDQTVTE